MKWLLTNRGSQVDVHPRDDILPHRLDGYCPCRVTVLYMEKDDELDLAMENEDIVDNVFIAGGTTTVILHTHNLKSLLSYSN